MKNKYFKSILLLSMVLPVVGCNNNGKTEITIFSEFLYPNLEKLIEDTYPEVDFKYELSFYPSEQTRRLRLGHGPSLVVTNGYDSEFYDKYLLDISSSFASTTYDESIMRQISNNGKAYCLPYPGKYLGYIYNATYLEENDIAIPTNNTELISAISTLRSKNIGVGEDNVSVAIVNNYSNNIGTYYLSHGIPDFFGTIDGAQWLTGFKNKNSLMANNLDYIYSDIIEPMVDNEFIDTAVLSHKRNAIDYPVRMLEGSLFATFGDSGLFNDIISKKGMSDNEDYSFKMLPLLSDKNNHPWTVALPSNYIGINKAKSSKEQELCTKILELISTPTGQGALMSDVNGGFSYLKQEVTTNTNIPEGLQDCVREGYVYYPKITGRITDYLGEVIVNTMDEKVDINESLKKVDDYNINGSEEVDSNFHAVGIINEDMKFEDYNVRKFETTLGNLVADSVKFASNADIAVINGGGIRSSLYKGEVYDSDIKALCPFDNLVVVINMTGEIMYEMMENSLATYNDSFPAGRFLQVSGIKYTFDNTKEIGERVVSITLSDGTAINRSRTYKVAINNYMAGNSGYDLGNGDGFTMLNIYDDKVEKGKVTLVSETDKTYYDCLADYFNEYYTIDTKIEGRITKLNNGKISEKENI